MENAVNTQEKFLCEICGETLQCLSGFRRHLKNLHPNSDETKRLTELCKNREGKRQDHKIFTCEICGKSLQYLKTLQRHLKNVHSISYKDERHCSPKKLGRTKKKRVRHDKKIVKCEICGKTLQYLGSLQRHIKNVHSSSNEDERQCSPEELHSINKKGLRHGCIKLYTCEICGKTLRYLSSLKRHKEECHISNNKVVLFECKICGKQWKTSKSLRRHSKTVKCSSADRQKSTNLEKSCKIVEKRVRNDTFFCLKCNINFASSSLLKAHKRLCKREYDCDQCLETFSTSYAYDRHVYSHTRKKPYTCDICQRSFATEVYLTDHKLHHEGRKSFPCEFCPSSFFSQNDLKFHRVKHTGERNYPCELCGFAFRRQRDLNRHIRTHTGERPYKCPHCNEMFGRPFILRSHIRVVHEMVKDYKCDDKDCGRSFGTNAEKLVHMNVHLGLRPYKCDFCSKDYPSLPAYKSHMITHTGEKAFKCEICLEEFRYYGRLRTHYKHIHGKELPLECKICKKRFAAPREFHVHMRTANIH